ncbi:DUF2931 family protein [Vibrio hepatarius]|uniref:DUF2931 family protein n=1 Tax=Vibrio hepatarius TaxID=171383 RepID=UPI00142D4020|nr:DUF2931 family protein [Vibrio hepatarius]
MKKSYKILFPLFIIFSATSCAKQNYPDDERYKPWRIGAAISYEFSSGVLEAYGVNKTEDWTSVMLPYGNLVSGKRLNLENYKRSSYPEYDGNSLILNNIINFTPNQLGLGFKTLPEQLYVYWRNNGTDYATVVDVTPQIKAAITKPYPHPSWRFEGENCYQTDFIFGLLPDGRAKLWLEGCNIYTYVGEYQPTKVMPPADPSKIKNKPIPWDKVNQVWYDKEKYKMQNIDDVVKL